MPLVGKDIDPVCGKIVNKDPSLSETFRGREYFFCSEECMHRFASEPERYVEGVA